MIKAQGGDENFIRYTEKFPKAAFKREIFATEDGFVTKMNAEAVGKSSMMLETGRETKNSVIDFSAGIVLRKKFGDAVNVGDNLATLYSSEKKFARRSGNLLFERR